MTRYVVITPVRDEEEFISSTIECMSRQTVLPSEWVIVNDGSSDRTGDIVDQFADRLPWIHPVHRSNRGYRKPGGGVVDAFNDGYNALGCSDWDFVVKLDGDLSFTKDYFEKCFAHFQKEPQLGLGGGGIYHDVAGTLTLESNPKFHVRGATKIYRKACWEAIGGLLPAPGWDTVDEVKANMLGWRTRSFEDLKLHHHRVTGAAQGHIRDRVKHGVACHVSGYHPLFVAASCAYRIFRKPYVIGALATMYGFVRAAVLQTPQVSDPGLVRYTRTQQLRRLCGLSTIWR